MTGLILLVVVAVCSASPLERIVNGDNAAQHSWPWQLSLQYGTSGKSHICGAVILSENYALTAAHCVVHDSNPSNFKVIAGAHQIANNEAGRQEATVAEITVHSRYDGNAGGFPNDIAVLRLSKSFSFNDKVQPANLPTSTSTSFFTGRDCFITGWGRLEGGGSMPNTLQEAPTTVLSHSSCRSALGLTGLLYLSQSAHICVFTGSNGACNGDSGGPLVCDVNGQWQLAGVTSWGLQNCPTGSPSVYTRVSNYLSFISNQM